MRGAMKNKTKDETEILTPHVDKMWRPYVCVCVCWLGEPKQRKAHGGGSNLVKISPVGLPKNKAQAVMPPKYPRVNIP